MSPQLKRRSWLQQFIRRALLYTLVPYVVVAGMLALFQRRLIFPGSVEPTRVVPALPSDGSLETVEIPTTDGLELNGWLWKAKQTDSQVVRGLIVYFPGNAGWRRDRSTSCQLLADLQFDVLLVDYRGYGDNPGAPSETRIAADAHEIWKFALETLQVPPRKIYLYGESLGGAVATRLAAELSALNSPPAGLLVSATFSSMTAAASWHYPLVPVKLLLLDRFESVDHITRVTCPIVAIHGTEDTIVPLQLAHELFAAAPTASAAGVPKKMITVPGADHESIPFDVLQAAMLELNRRSATPMVAENNL